jgi:DeoR/GlpR family transcriptional regulator of sugar metabolism
MTIVLEAGLTSEKRRARIVEHLHRTESASIESLAELLLVSKMTIHRDLDRLEEQRVVRKSRGGATLSPSTVFEADYTYRAQLALSEKMQIARYVAERVERGMAILVDDSSTAAQVIPLVINKRPVTIITNSLYAISSYCRVDGVSLLALGGSYDRICDAFFGSVAEQSIARLRVDLAVLSTAAIRGSNAYFHNPEVARFKLACIAVADQTVLMVDHTKFQKSALHLFSHLNVFNEVVTTNLLDATLVETLRNDRVNLSLLRYVEPVDKAIFIGRRKQDEDQLTGERNADNQEGR